MGPQCGSGAAMCGIQRGAPDLDQDSKEDDMASRDQHGSVPQGSEQYCGWNFSNMWLDNLDPVNRQSDVK